MIWRTVFGLQALCFVQCAVGDLLVSTQNYVILLVWAFLLPTEQIPLWLFSLGWYITFILPKSTQLWQSCMLGQVVISCKILLNGHFLYLLIFFFGCTTDKSKSWDVICHVTFFQPYLYPVWWRGEELVKFGQIYIQSFLYSLYLHAFLNVRDVFEVLLPLKYYFLLILFRKRFEQQQKMLEEDRKRRQFEEQKQKLRLLSGVKPKVSETFIEIPWCFMVYFPIVSVHSLVLCSFYSVQTPS